MGGDGIRFSSLRGHGCDGAIREGRSGFVGARRTSDERFFPSYYNSFKWATLKHDHRLVRRMYDDENKGRAQLIQHEAREYAQIFRCFAVFLGSVQPSLHFQNYLSIPDMEAVERCTIASEYYDMLLEACEALHTLMHRAIAFCEEPTKREWIERVQTPEWIDSRRLEVQREEAAAAAHTQDGLPRMLTYFEWRQNQQYQAQLFAQEETRERSNIERLQRLNVGIIANMYHTEFRKTQPHQNRFEERRVKLSDDLSISITAAEATERSSIHLQQGRQFREIEAAEIMARLAARVQQ